MLHRTYHHFSKNAAVPPVSPIILNVALAALIHCSLLYANFSSVYPFDSQGLCSLSIREWIATDNMILS